MRDKYLPFVPFVIIFSGDLLRKSMILLSYVNAALLSLPREFACYRGRDPTLTQDRLLVWS